MFRLTHMARLVVVLWFAVAASFSGYRLSSAASSTLSQQGIKAVLVQKQPVTLKVLNWAQGGQQYWNTAATAFTKKYPWIKVQYQQVPFERYYATEDKYIASNSGPDVMANNVGSELIERKSAYQPLNAVLRPYVKDLIRYSDGCADFSAAQPCYGLPQSFQGNVMYYDRAILIKAGLNPNNPPQTWTDMGTACGKIRAIGKACMAVGYGTSDAYWIFPEIARNFLTQQQMIAMFRGKIPWTDPKMVNILKYMAQMADKGWFQKDAATTVYLPDAGDVFIRGDAAFTPGIVSDVYNWKFFGDKMGYSNVGVMRWPVINPRAPLAHKFSGVEGFVHGVTAWSQHPNEAFLYVAWLAGVENANLFLRIAGGQPINTRFDKTLVKAPQFTAIQGIIQNATVHSGVLLSGREADALSRGFQQILQKQISVSDWVGQMQQALDASPGKNGQ